MLDDGIFKIIDDFLDEFEDRKESHAGDNGSTHRHSETYGVSDIPASAGPAQGKTKAWLPSYLGIHSSQSAAPSPWESSLDPTNVEDTFAGIRSLPCQLGKPGGELVHMGQDNQTGAMTTHKCPGRYSTYSTGKRNG